MINLFRAEWTKTNKNFLLISFTVWIIPVGAAALFLVFFLITLLTGESEFSSAGLNSPDWTRDVQSIWAMILSFPLNVFGRLLPIAFMATVFAGEYQWGTWKNILVRNRRATLVLMKIATLVIIEILSILITSLLIGSFIWIGLRYEGLSYDPQITGEVLAGFVQSYGQEMLLGSLALLILAAYAALAAIISRSILGALLIAFGLSMLDPMSLFGLIILRSLLKMPELINLYQFTPSYSIQNLQTWFLIDAPYTQIASGFTAEPGIAASFGILALWIIGLISLAIWIFQRQDITT